MNSLSEIINRIEPLDEDAMTKARLRQDTLTKPQGSMGRLEELSIQLAGIQIKPIPRIQHKAIITIAGDHGVVAEKVGNWPQEVTAQMVNNFLAGGAGINVLTRLVGARLIVADMGVATKLRKDGKLLSYKIGHGTNNMCLGPAMTAEEAVIAIEIGINIAETEIAKGLDIIGTGDMGIGNTTASSAIYAVIAGKPVSEVTGRGTGITDEQLSHKIKVIERAISLNKPNPSQPLDVLAKVGGFEIGGLAGVMLAAAAHHVPVVIDGFISGTAALIAVNLSPKLKDYLIAAHVSAEAGHKSMLNYLGLTPLLSLDMRLGEGTGAALGIFIAEASAKLLAEMATFDEAIVSGKNEAKS